jgi:hypothetical protein
MMLKLEVNGETILRTLRLEDALQLFALVDENRSHLRRWMSWVDAITDRNLLFQPIPSPQSPGLGWRGFNL